LNKFNKQKIAKFRKKFKKGAKFTRMPVITKNGTIVK